MTWPCFDWQSLHWESWYITVEDRDKVVPEDQFLGSACRSPNCGFCSSEIFRKRINRGRNESATTHCSSSRARSPVEQSSTLVFIIPPRFSYFTPSSPRSSPTTKPFCRLESKIVPPPKDQQQYQLFQISSHQLGGLSPSCECSEDFVVFSLLTYPIVSQQGLLNEYVKANPGRHGQQHGNGIHQSWQLVHLCFLFSGFLPKLLLILDSFSVLIPLPCYRHELFFTISFINFSPLCSDKCILVDRCTFNHVSWLKSCIQIHLLLKILSRPLRYT